MIIPLLLALASAGITCPVKISVTGWIRQGAAIRVMTYGDPLAAYEVFPEKLPFDTTIQMAPCNRCYAFWQGIAPTIKEVSLRVSSRAGSTIDIACDESDNNCGSGESYFKISKTCRLQ